ncbi:MAG: S1C family serine protease [Lachnospiraceae bacterium]|nr:S1C family serine protease [Lachnospiraceae bacterium]
MSEGKKNRNLSFIQETVKQKRFYQNRMVQRLLWSVASGVLFALAAVAVWAVAAPRISFVPESSRVEKVTLPEPEEQPEQSSDEEEPPVYIMEQVSIELEDYKKMYQQLMQIGSQVEKSLVSVSAVTTDTDWFDETYTSQSSVSGLLVEDNGVELLVLTDYEKVKDGERLLITFYDHTSAPAVLKKYDKNTGLAVLSVNLSDISESTREVILYADIGSSKTLRSGEPVIALGSPGGNYGSILFGNLTSVSQMAALYDGNYNVLTTDMARARAGSGVLISWSGKIIGVIQDRCEVAGQNNTIQAYGISDIMGVIEHLSNSQDIVYMGVVGADVTTAVSELEGIPIGVYVSEVALESPAIEAGLQPGDIITSMSGQTVTNLKDVMAILMKCSNGQNIQVICQRLNKTVYQELELSIDLKILE